jgi:hypothetical protein
VSDNLFNLKAPMLYRCSVLHYHTRLSRLYVRAFRPHQNTPEFYLLFSDVGYFEGPMSWEGADFGLASHQDCIDLMLRTGLIGEAILQFPDAYASITETARLYFVQTTHTPVFIIASSATMLQDVPNELK